MLKLDRGTYSKELQVRLHSILELIDEETSKCATICQFLISRLVVCYLTQMQLVLPALH